MEGLNIFESTLTWFGMGFIAGIFFAYAAKLIHTIWISTTKFFK